MYGAPIGSSGAARFGEHVSHASAELIKLINRYYLLNKIPLPWVKDW